MKARMAGTAVFLLLLFTGLPGLPVSAYSEEAGGWYTMGNTFMKTGNYTQAAGAYDRAVALEPTYFEALNGKADALNRAQQFAAALSVSDQVLALNPDYVQGWINRGYILYNLGRYTDELHAYEQAIALDPASPDAWFNKGYALAGMQRYDEAIAAFDRVRALDPSYPNLAANRRIAEQNRDAVTPWYVKNAVILGILAIACIGAGAWWVTVHAGGNGAGPSRRR